MDSLSQMALGAAVSVAVMGRRTAVWKAALWGAVAGTLPDLDAFIDHGDPVLNMTLHRGNSHALFWLTLAAPPLAALVSWLHRERGPGALAPRALWPRWTLALWLVLVTHALLDALTIYGTQLARPFSDHPYGVGSIFIIDPLYTLPLLLGLGLALRRPQAGGTGLRWNRAGLLLSTAYLGWGLLAQQLVLAQARQDVAAQGLQAQQMLATPTPFNSVLWRVLVMTPDGYHEGFRSLLDGARPISFERFERGNGLQAKLAGHGPVQRMAAFTHGFYSLSQREQQLLLTDLRMGMEPNYSFSFVMAERGAQELRLLDRPLMAGSRPDVRRGLAWIWRRAGGEPLPPPR